MEAGLRLLALAGALVFALGVQYRHWPLSGHLTVAMTVALIGWPISGTRCGCGGCLATWGLAGADPHILAARSVDG